MANYCSNCGDKLDAAVKFCTNCGSPVAGGSSVPTTERDRLPPSEGNRQEAKFERNSASDPTFRSSEPSNKPISYSGTLFQSIGPIDSDAEPIAWYGSTWSKVAAVAVLCTIAVTASVIIARKRTQLVPSDAKTSLANAPASQGATPPTGPSPQGSPVDAPTRFTSNHQVSFAPGTSTDQAAFADVASSKLLVQGSFDIAYEDLKGDGNKEIILQSTSTDFCGSGGCETVVLEKRGTQYVTLLDQNLFSPLAVTKEKVNGYAALASLDDKGAVAIGDKQGTPMYGKQMVYPMQPPSAAQNATPPTPSQTESAVPKTYTAYLSCGISGSQNLNPLACFAGSSYSPGTQLELTNGDQYGLYQVYQLDQLGQESPQGLSIRLHEHFAIKAQNASDTLILGLIIVDNSTGQVVFRKQVAQYGVIDVSN